VSDKKREISPEAREKLSRLARERHARGELGGSKFGKLGGRPRKDRAAKRVAESAQEERMARQIIQVFKDAVQPDQPMNIRIKAAEAWLGIEREEAKVSMQEEEHDVKQHSREELLEILSNRMTEGPIAELLRKQIEPETGIVDAEVVE
jgi:hypothetical protein